MTEIFTRQTVGDRTDEPAMLAKQAFAALPETACVIVSDVDSHINEWPSGFGRLVHYQDCRSVMFVYANTNVIAERRSRGIQPGLLRDWATPFFLFTCEPRNYVDPVWDHVRPEVMRIEVVRAITGGVA